MNSPYFEAGAPERHVLAAAPSVTLPQTQIIASVPVVLDAGSGVVLENIRSWCAGLHSPINVSIDDVIAAIDIHQVAGNQLGAVQREKGGG